MPEFGVPCVIIGEHFSAEILDIVLLSQLAKLDLHSDIPLELPYFYTIELGEGSELSTVLLFGQLEELSLVGPLVTALHFLLVLRAALGMLSRYVAAQRLGTFEGFLALRANVIGFLLPIFLFGRRSLLIAFQILGGLVELVDESLGHVRI